MVTHPAPSHLTMHTRTVPWHKVTPTKTSTDTPPPHLPPWTYERAPFLARRCAPSRVSKIEKLFWVFLFLLL
ncbi:MAG: hypothetical protein ACK559_33480, partial [bacterium]